MHVELVHIHVVDCFLLHGRCVAFLGHPLISSNHSYSVHGRELDHHVVGGGMAFIALREGLPNNIL